MIRSMTGFGRGETIVENKIITVEIRTVNSKQLDLSLRMPSAYRTAEVDMRATLTRDVQRGKCELSLSVTSSAAAATSSSINTELFTSYCQQIVSAFESAGVESAALTQEVALAALRMPDVMATPTETLSDAEREAAITAMCAAIVHLNEFRQQEGAILIADLLRRVDLIEGYLGDVSLYDQPRIEAIRERIREHVAKERIVLDNGRLEAEMIFYVEKLDVTEEKVRLKSHCDYFREVAAEEQGVGRKLGFIAQEMGREINTLGSKSNDAQMQRLVVQMKDELEKIKEQVLNIL
ncbi:MAG: YicC/YloC family endoribonuclease [Rikenellaceae bacterium]